MIETRERKVLLSCQLFEGLDEPALQALLDCFRPVVTTVRRDEFFAWEGEPIDAFHVLLEGELLLVRETREGNRTLRGLVEAGGLFGEVAAFGPLGTWPVSVQARREARILSIRTERIVNRCERGCSWHNTLVLNTMRILAKKALGLHDQLTMLSRSTLRQRIAVFLMQRYDEAGEGQFLSPFNILETADFLGVARPSLSRELARMKRDGLVASKGREFWITDVDEMRRLVDG